MKILGYGPFRVTAECEACGKSSRITKDFCHPEEGGFRLIPSFKCACGQSSDFAHGGNGVDRDPVQAFHAARAANPDLVESPVRCGRCRSTQITAHQKGFSVAKALTGATLVLGWAGLFAGFHGRQKVIVTCLSCGHQCQP